MKEKDTVRLSWFVVLLLLTSIGTIPAYSQTYDEWFSQGWDAGCEDSATGAQNQTEMNTPFTKGYTLGFAECSPNNAGNNTALTNMTQAGDETQATSTKPAYDIGCGDVRLNGNERYINQPGNEPSSQTEEFMKEYYAGYYGCGGTFPAEEGPQLEPPAEPPSSPPFPQAPEPSESPQPIQPPMQGGIDWNTVCNNLQAALVSSCDILVNSDNTLTQEGQRAVDCIRNGIALAGGGTLLASLPLPLVITALKILEEPTGCGGIVKWEAIGNVGDLRGIINLLT
jgi:hypothetical protein